MSGVRAWSASSDAAPAPVTGAGNMIGSAGASAESFLASSLLVKDRHADPNHIKIDVLLALAELYAVTAAKDDVRVCMSVLVTHCYLCRSTIAVQPFHIGRTRIC